MLRRRISFLRLFYNEHLSVTYGTVVQNIERHPQPDKSTHDSFDNVTKEIKDKLLFSSYLESMHESYGKRQNILARRMREHEEKYLLKMKRLKTPIPLSLKYYSDEYIAQPDDESEIDSISESEECGKSEEVFHLPYNEKQNIGKSWMTDYHYFNDAKLIEKEKMPANRDTSNSDTISRDTVSLKERFKRISLKKEIEDVEYEDEQWKFNYGEPDPNMSVTNVPCGGCGALLHCKDTSLPGFLPKEIFAGLSKSALKETICQRCHFLKEYNVALNINVNPAEYPKILSTIKSKRALVIIMVDLLDFPCSIWPGIMQIIGEKRPIVIVGNKVDLLPHDDAGYLDHIADCLTNSIMSSVLCKSKIKNISLISAKTGYGVETLINQLHKLWEFNGDVYLIGCTNVGKSTLFNALLQSDYCKVEAVDLLQRATVSQWPGTTLNLLKFPILKPAAWRLELRSERLSIASAAAEEELYQLKKRKYNNKMPVLLDHIGRTFANPKSFKSIEGDPFSYQMSSGFKQSSKPMGINEANQMYGESRWCYDTPGVVHPDQILSILTVEELMLTLTKHIIKPRTYIMKTDTTLFLAGIGRIDFIESEEPVLFTVFASPRLPVTICNTADADEVYTKLLGTNYFVVPFGGEKRLANWPGLKKGEERISVSGIGRRIACCDIVLSSAGWVSITSSDNEECVLDVWTPGARGIHVRTPSLIQYSATKKGPRIQGTPAYCIGKSFQY